MTSMTVAADPESQRQYGDTLRVLFRGPWLEVGTFRCPPDHPLHRDSGPIRDFSVVFPRTAGSVQHEGGRPFFVSPLVAPLYNRGQRYVRCGDNPHNREGDRSDWIGFSDASLVLGVVREFDPAVEDSPERPFRFEFAPASAVLYARQRMLLAALQRGEVLEPAVIEGEALDIVRSLLGAAYGARQAGRRDRREHDAYARARLELLRSFREPLSLSTLARRVEVSVPHLTRLFRLHSGRSVHQTLIELRLRASLDALRDPRCDVSALAYDLGFSSHSHFTAAFRRAFGAPPSRLRGRVASQGGPLRGAWVSGPPAALRDQEEAKSARTAWR